MLEIDFRKELPGLYAGKVGKSVVVDVPPMAFLMIDGHGDPYTEAVQALYAAACSVKFLIRKEQRDDFGVTSMEGPWWADNFCAFIEADNAAWDWTVMVMQPPIATGELVNYAIAGAARKKRVPGPDRIRFDTSAEGRAAQVLCVSPYADEGPTIAAFHAFIATQGGALNATCGRHHESCLGDPRRTDPARLRTIIRQPC